MSHVWGAGSARARTPRLQVRHSVAVDELAEHAPRLARSLGGARLAAGDDQRLPQGPAPCSLPRCFVERHPIPGNILRALPVKNVQAMVRSHAGSPTAQEPKSITAASRPSRI